MKIVLDAMGGDNGVAPIIAGLRCALDSRGDFSAIVVGDEREICKHITPNARVAIHHCENAIKMEDAATNALKKKDTSIYQAVELVCENAGDVVISAGHSGASMSLATLRFGRVGGILRPAICTTMPRIDKKTSIILDAGANVDCKAEHLVQFAQMGYEYAKSVLGYQNPRVGLLANGEEDSKGNELTKEAFKTLQNFAFFKGNVEGNDIFNASIDVIVCDGFAGNLVLKASEGVAEAISAILKEEIGKSLKNKIGALLMKDAFMALKKRTHYAEYGGAPLLGVKKNLIICHGKSNARAIECAIYQGISAVESQVVEKIEKIFTQE
ncbi:phosphate acyltransferase PlsX [Helicobacter sp. 23-1045]